MRVEQIKPHCAGCLADDMFLSMYELDLRTHHIGSFWRLTSEIIITKKKEMPTGSKLSTFWLYWYGIASK